MSGTLTRAPVAAGAKGIDPAGRAAAPVEFGAVWALLVVNTLAFNGVSIIGFPHAVGQLVTMGSLAAALLLALLRNPRPAIRPSLFMSLLSLLAVAAALSSMRMEAGHGAVLRAARYLTFVIVLWLLTPLWSNPLSLIRSHLRVCIGILAVVAIGIVASGGKSLRGDQGRLVGAIWPMPPPQVAEFSAVLVGLLVIAWMTGLLDGRAGLIGAPAVLMLMATHTRTALAGLVLGLTLAAASTILTSRRAGNFLGAVLAVTGLAALAAGPFVMHWLQRGESAQELTNLTGRGAVWGVLLSQPRSGGDRLLGTGLGEKKFGGNAIDSTWLSVYWEQGLIGIVLVAALYLALLLGIVSARPSPGRTFAVFLTGYLLMASYTEVGIGDAGTYVLLAFLAAACIDHAHTADPIGRPT
jgi:hypothetical protein